MVVIVDAWAWCQSMEVIKYVLIPLVGGRSEPEPRQLFLIVPFWCMMASVVGIRSTKLRESMRCSWKKVITDRGRISPSKYERKKWVCHSPDLSLGGGGGGSSLLILVVDVQGCWSRLGHGVWLAYNAPSAALFPGPHWGSQCARNDLSVTL